MLAQMLLCGGRGHFADSRHYFIFEMCGVNSPFELVGAPDMVLQYPGTGAWGSQYSDL